ncbi:succinate dehydrogenase [ubiquinone] cytochrome b small subunit, mitochondrial isoform X2 [Venturia canescens]|nr:succinate dehydrogenase [ubiquinone] cytochrome b small subunit, mitochondrial isoform X2 [Venturia canescens]XP_043278688.1 succinate dehydrogenase [ubiquinone] cytochrome b small subunit, mitochondrial isoform X2 [Venturia canescens]
MANLALCRMVRSASVLSRLSIKNNIFVSPKAHGFLRQVESASPFSTSLQHPLRASSGALSHYSRKVLSELPTSSLLQCRASSTHGDHVRLWQIERIVSAAFIVLLPACIMLENSVVDALFATLVVMHAHWGLEAVVLDYIRPSIFGSILPKVAFGTLYLVSALTFVGLLALIYNGPGIGKTVKNLWSIGSEPSTKKA